MTDRQQQKLYLTQEARAKLRAVAAERGLQMSEVVEELVMEIKEEWRKKND